MAYQAASATMSLRDALKAGPLCLQRTLDPRKISAMTLNSTRPRCGTSLILYLGAVAMPRCSSRARSLSAGIGAPNFSSSVSLGEVALHRRCLLCHGSPATVAPQQVSPEPGGSQGPSTLSQKVPPPVMSVEVRRAVTPRAVTHFEVPTDQRVNGRCSCVR
jgi:hypothetical protein